MGRSIAEELYGLAFDLLEAEYGGADVGELLDRAHALLKETDYYVSAAVRDARHEGVSWDDVARAASVSVATARGRWGEVKVMRRLQVRAVERAAARQAPAAVPDERPKEGREAMGRASRQLAAALSQLHQDSGLMIRQVAASTELSPSYVSRILSVDRTPSWQVVRQLVEVFGGDPLELRVLWEIAQGVPPAPQDFIEAATRLNGVLRGLYRAAGCPGVMAVCEQANGALDPEVVKDILAGTQVPTWENTGRFVSVMGGHPADIRPQWEAVYSSLLGACDPVQKAVNGASKKPADRPSQAEGR
ncbi:MULTISPECIES: helix-turn-helix transcriptional regulator [unclassified Streptomyces]|uniref:helix-turn-helix domain-containing protein n=1 Tax=unclassified Streptomyces TaxID=2593676 RepID=UPI002E788FB6|nr:helix-turn-helix transcriptional regulator [Streptomyces sp. JV190]MEE1839719.1 helix-turn-helix transcriptional regulator [Streptomyces sp. JV190]